MRYHGFALAGLLLAGTTLCGQQPPQQAPQQPTPQAPAAPLLDPAHNRLDAVLLQWEQQMKAVQTLAADELVRTTVDKTFGATDVYEGKARYMSPDLALLEMHKKGKPEVFEKFVCTGAVLYEYVPQNKQIRAHELPPRKPGQVADDNFLSFLFGMKAEEAKRRYALTLVKEDNFYFYIEIGARYSADQADFQRARLVLTKAGFLPRQLWFEQPNGNEVTWDIPRVQCNVPINRTEFSKPEQPAGWELVRVPRNPGPQNPAPRVIRPQK